MNDKILFVITFVYGVIIPLTYTQLFKFRIRTIVESIFNLTSTTIDKDDSLSYMLFKLLFNILDWLDRILLTFSLFYQVYFWFFKIVKLEV